MNEIGKNGIHELVENFQFLFLVGVNGGKELAEHFRNIPKIEVLNLSNIYIYNIGNSKIGVVGFDTFFKNMKYIPNLRNLNLSKYFFIKNQ